MINSKYTGMIKIKGWSVSDALSYWGRTYSWYHRQCKGGGKAALRLECMNVLVPRYLGRVYSGKVGDCVEDPMVSGETQ